MQALFENVDLAEGRFHNENNGNNNEDPHEFDCMAESNLNSNSSPRRSVCNRDPFSLSSPTIRDPSSERNGDYSLNMTHRTSTSSPLRNNFMFDDNHATTGS